MHPLDDVVAHVHRVGAGRHQLHAKRVAITGGLESLVPPARSFDQRRAHWFGRAAIDVIDDGLDRIAHRGRRIFLLQAVVTEVAFSDRLADWRRKVHEANPGISGTWVINAGLKTGWR